MPHPHVHSPAYAPPVLRAPSPASSLGTTYAPDATSFSDTEAELSQATFEKKWEDKLRLGREFAREWNGDLGEGEGEGDEDGYEGWNGMRAVRDREREGWGREPLFNIGESQRTPAEDKYIHERIVSSLRYQIHLLEQNEIFEQTLLTRGGPSEAALSLDHQPSTNDIDSLMRSMMTLGPSGPSNTPSASATPNSRSNRNGSVGTANTTSAGTITHGPWSRGIGMESVDVNATPGRTRSAAKGKGRSRR
ncbi:hypothetical protein PILCRDRAFT_821864 [Piloderma croceum F 1598]|uniref:Uncharacterized protein n=1 Tax=Piloderma croceum (strain F 1598) TaxID=765440 RepID=A0A0C3BUK6_PILCF|nr:hypothetical protein PILCRDRAFT_821864 [Piloderma croceum F 1598]